MSVDIQRIQMDQLACWRVRRGNAELLIAEQGAQILSYRQDNAQPIIWLSEEATFRKNTPVRGGVPVCWPWFGDLARNPRSVQDMYQGEHPAPAHGLVRDIDWALQSQDSANGNGNLVFVCDGAKAGLAGWPHAMSLTLNICLADELHIELVSQNNGETPVTISQALHSYFAVSDIHQVAIQGLADRRYIETLENWEERRQHGDLRFTGETDRIYLEPPATLSLIDPLWNRRITLRTSGSSSAVLWNPWVAKAQRLSQFADDAWQRMLCIETANVLDDQVQLVPGSGHSLKVSICSEPL